MSRSGGKNIHVLQTDHHGFFGNTRIQKSYHSLVITKRLSASDEQLADDVKAGQNRIAMGNSSRPPFLLAKTEARKRKGKGGHHQLPLV